MSELHPFQLEGAQWLADQRYGLLADAMGLGKTVQAIRAADLIAAQRVAVVCPAIGRINWRREFEKWSLQGPELFIESYDTLAVNKKARDAYRAFRPEVTIADEAHYLKSPEAKRTRMLYGQHCHNTGLLSVPRRVWLLSGTPTPNGVTELWTHLRALWPELITHNGEPLSSMGFLKRYADYRPSVNGPIILGNKKAAVPEMRAILKQIMLRRKGNDALKLPPIVWQPTYLVEPDHVSAELAALEASPEVTELRRVLDAALEGDTRELFTDEEPVAIATVRRLTAELKARPVARLLAEELRDGAYDKIVVFAIHRAALDAMAAVLESFGVGHVRGGQSSLARQAEIDRFQNDASCRVILVQLDAGYHTITLHAAAQVALLEQSWTPDINVQAAKRAHRIGQTRPVFVRNFGLAGSIDEAVTHVQSRKAAATLELLE